MAEEYRNVHVNTGQTEAYLNLISKTDMSNSQKKKITKFVDDLKIGKAGQKVKDRRVASYLQFLVRLHEYFKKDLDKLTEKELTEFYKALQENKLKKKNGMPYSEASKDEYTKTLKRYLGWVWGNDSTKYVKGLRWMKGTYAGSDKKAITLKEVERVLVEEENVRNQCLFMFLFDSGARIEEALNVRIKDLKSGGDKDKFFVVNLRGTKTAESKRTLPIPLTTKYLNKWLKEHPTKNEEDYLFPLQYDNSRKIIREMSKKVLGYSVKPHELRHSSATHYIQHGGFGANNIGGFYYRYGWKFGSDQALTYIKQYMYGGELSQEKVVQHIVSDRMTLLEKEIDELKTNQSIIMQMLMEEIGFEGFEETKKSK